jgi:hypothetical protein
MIEEENAASSAEHRDVVRRSERTEDARHSDRDSARTISVSGEPIRCAVEDCSNHGDCTLRRKHLCVHHFITYCFVGLRDCTVSRCLNATGETLESCDALVRECILETAKVLQRTAEIDRVRRGHLLDVLLWATELAAKRSGSD